MPDWMSILLGVLSTIAAVFSAAGAVLAWKIAKQAFEWQRRRGAPEVRVTVRTDPECPQIIFIVIENAGGSIAYNVRFELSRPIPASAFVIEASAAKQKAFEGMDNGPLITGVPALAPGDVRKLVWGQYGGIYSWLGDGFVRVVANFKDESGEPRETLSVLEVKSFEHTDASGDDSARKSVKALEIIAQCIDGASSGSRPFVMETPDNRRVRQRVEQLREKRHT